ncbi:MAG: alpha/beta hydrolase [Phycisphaerales bacterium]|nr:alpha/beta hydrolase [Phycisphaerales bacterium]
MKKFFNLFRRREWHMVDASFANYPYATQSASQKMDIYLPSSKGKVNVILNIHGGGWCTGDKTSDTDACKKAAKMGYVAASMNYRMLIPWLSLPRWLQPVNCKGMLDDIGNAIAALKAKLIAEDYTPNKLAITGWSAGGHLAMLYGGSRYQQSSIPIAFLFTDCAPTDLTDAALFSNLRNKSVTALLSALAGRKISRQDVFNKAPTLRELSPLYSVDSGSPPILMRYGALDNMIPRSQGTAMQAALNAANVQNDLFVYPNTGHDLHKPDPSDAGISDAYMTKLREYLAVLFHDGGEISTWI